MLQQLLTCNFRAEERNADSQHNPYLRRVLHRTNLTLSKLNYDVPTKRSARQKAESDVEFINVELAVGLSW